MAHKHVDPPIGMCQFKHYMSITKRYVTIRNCVATLLWVKWEDETPTPKVGDLESFGTPERLEFDKRGKNTSYWGVLGVIGKVLKCRCLKCPRIGHLDI